ncbi:MAG TPA: hypothetical protein PKA63_04285 [Oligoflexia bacterium]|nr:hypothetical protein [Oligoflexia bacterium]HMP47868.1 hypothetical protein [Oligoflexia bacterium]
MLKNQRFLKEIPVTFLKHKFANLCFYPVLVFSIVLLAACNSGSKSSSETTSEPGSQDQVSQEGSKFLLEGTLTNQTGDPVIGVGVLLEDTGISTTTDDSGAFEFLIDKGSLSASDVRVTFTGGAGQTTLNLGLDTYPDRSLRADFILNEDSGDVVLDRVTPGGSGVSLGNDTRGCTSNLDCESQSLYCFYPEGTCGESGNGICIPRPEVCTMIYAPVCGCDNVTHASNCGAASAGVSVRSEGECGK